ncbi:MAG: 8-oxo-dGTP diphosphatase MutT [Methylotenera sp.]
MANITQVAVAIIQKEDQAFLLASRPEGKPWAGWWEFPGGKIEAGELPEDALARELQEELGILPIDYQPWQEKRFDYPETHDSPAKTVHLHFYFVTKWEGEMSAIEGQTFSWQMPGQVTVKPILPANLPIMDALASLAGE